MSTSLDHSERLPRNSQLALIIVFFVKTNVTVSFAFEDPEKHRNVRGNLLVLYTDTAGGMLVTSTVPVLDGSGWTTFSAIVWRQVLRGVDTPAGAFTTANTTKIYLSRATRVLLLLL